MILDEAKIWVMEEVRDFEVCDFASLRIGSSSHSEFLSFRQSVCLLGCWLVYLGGNTHLLKKLEPAYLLSPCESPFKHPMFALTWTG